MDEPDAATGFRAAAALLSVQCPECGRGCADQWSECPNCGRVLRPSARRQSASPGPVGEIRFLRIVGLGLIGVGIVVVMTGAAYGIEVAASGAVLAFVGLLTNSLAGIWGALERIAQNGEHGNPGS